MAFGVVMGFLPAEVAPECSASRIEYKSHWRGVPDCEDAVYHPAMTALKWTAAALVALFAFPAHADVSGPACVTDAGYGIQSQYDGANHDHQEH